MNCQPLSLTRIAAECGLDSDQVANYLKSILVKFIEQARLGQFCQLDLEIGKICAYPNGSLQFSLDSISGEAQDDPRFIVREDRAEGKITTLIPVSRIGQSTAVGSIRNQVTRPN